MVSTSVSLHNCRSHHCRFSPLKFCNRSVKQGRSCVWHEPRHNKPLLILDKQWATPALSSGDGGSIGSGGSNGNGGDGSDDFENGGFDGKSLFTGLYALLVAMGGVIGFFKAGSKKSLIAGGGFGLFVLCCSLAMGGPYDTPATFVALGLSCGLAYVMAKRFQSSGKIMPAGVTAGASVAMAVFLGMNVL